MADRPLILITNDDGVDSPGLHAAAEAVADLGDLLIMAPAIQQSGAGRSFMMQTDNAIYPIQIPLNGGSHIAYKSNVSPAQSVVDAVLELAERPIDLCISGINYGENVGSGITASGTVGAAMEAADTHIPALAVSLQVSMEFFLTHNQDIDFSAAAHFTRYFAQQTLKQGLPQDVDLLKIDVPALATPQTEWQTAFVSRQRYFEGVKPETPVLGQPRKTDYRINIQHDKLEPGSDIHTLIVEKKVAVVPISIDLTAPVILDHVTQFFDA